MRRIALGGLLPGRTELLEWLNNTLSLSPRYSSLEDCADCVAYGQLVAALHPEAVPSSRRLRLLPRDKKDCRENLDFVITVLEQAPPTVFVLPCLADTLPSCRTLTIGVLLQAGVACPCELSQLNVRSLVYHLPFLQWLYVYIERDASSIRTSKVRGTNFCQAREFAISQEKQVCISYCVSSNGFRRNASFPPGPHYSHPHSSDRVCTQVRLPAACAAMIVADATLPQ